MKKNNAYKLEIYCDEKLQWARAYTALGEKRLFMSIFLLQNERIQKLAREVDGIQATRVVTNMVKSLR